jgi:hypothetical protein
MVREGGLRQTMPISDGRRDSDVYGFLAHERLAAASMPRIGGTGVPDSAQG